MMPSKEAGTALGQRSFFKGSCRADSGSLVADEHRARSRNRGASVTSHYPH
jgi:hypothetical protein